MDWLLGSEDQNVTGELLQKFDKLGQRVDIEDKGTKSFVRDNVAVVVADISPENPLTGLRISAGRNDTFSYNCFDFITGMYTIRCYTNYLFIRVTKDYSD